MTLSLPNALSNNTNADATKVQANLDAIVDYINTYAILKDASVAFTGVQSGPASDPTTSNQLARKAYVDATVAAAAPTLGGDLTGTTTNAQLAVGAVVNADVNASAAISYSKLAGVLHTGSASNAQVTISTSAPSGGAAGDLWFKY